MSASQQEKTLYEMAKSTTVPDTVLDIFGGLTAADPDTDLTEIFSAESAKLFLARVGNVADLLSVSDTYEEALAKIDAEITRLEKVRKELMREVFKQIQPLEKSYRSVALFFENAYMGAKGADPIDFYLINADPKAIKRTGQESGTLETIRDFLGHRNDNFDFRMAISNLVVPGWLKEEVRKALEVEADKYGMLLIGDLDDQPGFAQLTEGFGNKEGAKYKSLKRPQDQAATDVLMAGYVMLREKHADFESIPGKRGTEDDGLYAPSSMLFAGAMVRTDRSKGVSQGPVGMKYGKITGVDRVRFEPRVSEAENMTMERQLVTLIRSGDRDLCFLGNRSQADDPKGLMKFFTTYRIFRLVERVIANRVREVVGQALSREIVDEQVLEPIKDLFEKLKQDGVIQKYDWPIHDYNEDDYAQGIVTLNIAIKPVGPAEVFNISIREQKKKASA